MVETGQASNVLLITSEVYSKHIHPADKSVRTLFGDAATATLVSAASETSPGGAIGPIVYGTDGSGAENLIVPAGGMRARYEKDSPEVTDENGSRRTQNNLYMNGPEVLNFTLRAIPVSIDKLLEKAACALSDIDLFVFHQANRFMLDYLRKKLRIPEEKFCISLQDCGNTVSSSIPIAFHHALAEGRVHTGDRIMMVGFGVGYSWAGALVDWAE
jgi:3-oxoacyl-[acyl-carrier-protein] synthase-3